MPRDKKVIKLLNGPLHGMEWPGDEREFIDLMENTTGKVRRYRRSDTAMFVKEWESKEEYDKEVHPDHPAGS